MNGRPCYGCIDRMVWYLWPRVLRDFRSHTCKGAAVPFATEWAPDDMRDFWLARYALPSLERQ